MHIIYSVNVSAIFLEILIIIHLGPVGQKPIVTNQRLRTIQGFNFPLQKIHTNEIFMLKKVLVKTESQNSSGIFFFFLLSSLCLLVFYPYICATLNRLFFPLDIKFFILPLS